MAIAAEQNAFSPFMDLLSRRLRTATILSSQEISPDVVTMNSRALVKSSALPEGSLIELVYPADNDGGLHKVNIFSSPGIAIFGRRVGDVLCWKTFEGLAIFKVTDVIFQPEASHNFQ